MPSSLSCDLVSRRLHDDGPFLEPSERDAVLSENDLEDSSMRDRLEGGHDSEEGRGMELPGHVVPCIDDGCEGKLVGAGGRVQRQWDDSSHLGSEVEHCAYKRAGEGMRCDAYGDEGQPRVYRPPCPRRSYRAHV